MDHLQELMLVLAKVTLFEISPLKYNVKILSVSWFRLGVYPVLCGVRLIFHTMYGQSLLLATTILLMQCINIFTVLGASSAYLSKEWEYVHSEYNLHMHNLGNKNIHFTAGGIEHYKLVMICI
jgi:hypothetical protein